MPTKKEIAEFRRRSKAAAILLPERKREKVVAALKEGRNVFAIASNFKVPVEAVHGLKMKMAHSNRMTKPALKKVARALSLETRVEIMKLVHENKNVNEIAQQVGVSDQEVLGTIFLNTVTKTISYLRSPEDAV